tara:strand:- start:293 stop:415 length:123 start_codon:yes stop_codon:yes gene_type:complete
MGGCSRGIDWCRSFAMKKIADLYGLDISDLDLSKIEKKLW